MKSKFFLWLAIAWIVGLLPVGLQAHTDLLINPLDPPSFDKLLEALPRCLEGLQHCLLALDANQPWLHVVDVLRKNFLYTLKVNFTAKKDQGQPAEVILTVLLVLRGDVVIVATSYGRMIAIDLWTQRWLWHVEPYSFEHSVSGMTQLDDGNLVTALFRRGEFWVHSIDWKMHRMIRLPMRQHHPDISTVQVVTGTRFLYVATFERVTVFQYNQIKTAPCFMKYRQHQKLTFIMSIVPLYDCSRQYYITTDTDIVLLIQNTYFDLHPIRDVRTVAAGPCNFNCSKYYDHRKMRREKHPEVPNSRRMYEIKRMKTSCRRWWPYGEKLENAILHNTVNETGNNVWRSPSFSNRDRLHSDRDDQTRLRKIIEQDWVPFLNYYNASRRSTWMSNRAQGQGRYGIPDSQKKVVHRKFPLYALRHFSDQLYMTWHGKCIMNVEENKDHFCFPNTNVSFILSILDPQPWTENKFVIYDL
jgi:hypothetical protein